MRIIEGFIIQYWCEWNLYWNSSIYEFTRKLARSSPAQAVSREKLRIYFMQSFCFGWYFISTRDPEFSHFIFIGKNKHCVNQRVHSTSATKLTYPHSPTHGHKKSIISIAVSTVCRRIAIRIRFIPASASLISFLCSFDPQRVRSSNSSVIFIFQLLEHVRTTPCTAHGCNTWCSAVQLKQLCGYTIWRRRWMKVNDNQSNALKSAACEWGSKAFSCFHFLFPFCHLVYALHGKRKQNFGQFVTFRLLSLFEVASAASGWGIEIQKIRWRAEKHTCGEWRFELIFFTRSVRARKKWLRQPDSSFLWCKNGNYSRRHRCGHTDAAISLDHETYTKFLSCAWTQLTRSCNLRSPSLWRHRFLAEGVSRMCNL